jgi:hypothetical protein
MVTDSNGCSSTSEAIYLNTVGVADAVNDLHGLVLYPNPSLGIVNLRTLDPIDWPLQVEVWDMFGQKVRTYDMAHLMDVVTFDLNDLAAAPYLIKITTFKHNKTEQAVIRFVKE